MKKKIIFLFISICLMATASLNVKASTTEATGNDAKVCGASTEIGIPCYDSVNKLFFANGVPIVITTDNGKTLITWKGGSQVVDDNVNVFGGAHNNEKEIPTTSITMENGKVNNIFGGGLHKSKVKTSNVIVKGGTLSGDICGGGAASFIKDDDAKTWYSSDAKNSPTIVENANVTVTGGTGVTTKSANKVSAIYGGGEGISYTKGATVKVSGGTYGFAIPGGVNGYTGNSTLDITGGTITNVQHGMRGANGDASITISDGKIDTVYVGTPANATVEKANLNITGGNVSNLKLATVKNAKGESSIGTVKYNESAVKSVDSNFKSGSLVPTMKLNVILDGQKTQLDVPTRDYSKSENVSLLKEELKSSLNLQPTDNLTGFYTSADNDKTVDFSDLKEGSSIYLTLDKNNMENTKSNTGQNIIFIVISIILVGFGIYLALRKFKTLK